MKKIDEGAANTGPNRRMVEALLRELTRTENQRLWDAYDRQRKITSEVRDKLLDCDEYRLAEVAEEEAHDAWDKGRKALDTKVKKVRQKYLASGITPAVLRLLNEIVDEVNG